MRNDRDLLTLELDLDFELGLRWGLGLVHKIPRKF